MPRSSSGMPLARASSTRRTPGSGPPNAAQKPRTRCTGIQRAVDPCRPNVPRGYDKHGQAARAARRAGGGGRVRVRAGAVRAGRVGAGGGGRRVGGRGGGGWGGGGPRVAGGLGRARGGGGGGAGGGAVGGWARSGARGGGGAGRGARQFDSAAGAAGQDDQEARHDEDQGG